MESLATLTIEYGKTYSPSILQPVNRTTERSSLIEQFLEPLNQSRREDNLRRFLLQRKINKLLTKDRYMKSKQYLRPLTHVRVNMVLSHLSTSDLYYFLSICTKAQSFSKKFWWEIKAR